MTGALRLFVLLGLVSVTGACAGVSQVIPGLGGSTPTYETATVQRGTLKITVTATGPVSAVTNVPLSFKTSGKLVELDVGVGQKVTKGQVLAKLDTSDLQTALEQAKATLAQDQASLAKTEAGSTPEQVGVAQASLDAAKQTLADAATSLPEAQASNAQNVVAAEKSLGSAATTLAGNQATLASTRDQAAKTLASDQQNLISAQDAEAKGLAADRVTLANAQKNLAAVQAQVAANLPPLELAVSQAKDSLYSQQISRDATCGHGGGSACDAANASVLSAETSVNTAQASLASGVKSAQTQIASAQASVDAAKAQLAKDQSSLHAAVLAAQSALAKDQAAQNGAVLSAQNQVKQNQAALSSAQTGVAQAQAQAATSNQSARTTVDQAQSSVRSAQANYKEVAAPPLPTDVETAKAAVANAQAAVDQAQSNLDSAVLTAPSDGTISAVNGAVNQWLVGGSVASTSGSSTSASALFTLTDLSNLQVAASVNEADVGKVKVGDPVTFAVQAYPNQTFSGRVLSIQPVGTTSSNVVTYTVTSSIQSTQNATLYPGMTATVTIVTTEDDNVLLVPNTALTFGTQAVQQGLVKSPSGSQGSVPAPAATATAAGGVTATATSGTTSTTTTAGSAGRGVVLLLQVNQLVPVAVTTGDTNGSNTVVISGLQAGETVVVGSSTGSSGGSSSSSSSGGSSSGGRGGPLFP